MPPSRGAKVEPHSCLLHLHLQHRVSHFPPQHFPVPITASLRAAALGGQGNVIPLCGSIRRRCRTTCDDSNGYLRGECRQPPPALSDKADRRPSRCTLYRASNYFGGGGGGCTNARSDLIQRDRLQRSAEDVSFYASTFVLLLNQSPPQLHTPCPGLTGKDVADRAGR